MHTLLSRRENSVACKKFMLSLAMVMCRFLIPESNHVAVLRRMKTCARCPFEGRHHFENSM